MKNKKKKKDYRLLGTLLTLSLCVDKESKDIRNRYANGYYVRNR